MSTYLWYYHFFIFELIVRNMQEVEAPNKQQQFIWLMADKSLVTLVRKIGGTLCLVPFHQWHFINGLIVLLLYCSCFVRTMLIVVLQKIHLKNDDNIRMKQLANKEAKSLHGFVFIKPTTHNMVVHTIFTTTHNMVVHIIFTTSFLVDSNSQ